MANEMLKFRKGKFAQIKQAAKVPGTIYIATDEKAMYVDIDTTENGRIRIGDFIRVETVAGIVPPYSESALYYVEADNALLKYMGAEKGWKQVNGTDDLSAEIASVKNRVSSLESTVGSATTGLVKDVATLKTTVGNASAGLVKDVAANAADIVELKKAVSMGEGDAEGIGAVVASLVTDLDTLETEVHGTTGDGGMKATLAQHASKIGALEEASAKHALKTDLNAYAKTADIEGTLAKVDTENGVTAAIEAAVAGEKSRAEAAEKALDNSIKAVKSTADGAVQSTAFEAWKTENTTAINNAKNAAIEAAEDYADGKITEEVNRADGKYATKTALESTNSTVSGHTASLAILNGAAETAGSVNWAKAAADAAMAKANEKTTMAEVEAKDYATKAEAQGYANAKDAAITAAQNAANAAKAAADAAQEDADAALEAIGDSTKGLTKAVADNAAAAAKAQKTADDYATAHAGDYTNAQIDSKIKAVSDVVAEHTGSLTTLTGTGAGSVAEAKKAGTDAQAAINEWKTAHAGDYTNTQIDAAVAEAKKAGTDAAATAKANGQAIQTLQGAVNTLNGNAQTAGSVAKAVADAEGRLNAEIANKINAANAMDYKGGVSSESELLIKNNVKMGDTYVATKKFTLDSATVYPGDLVIAQGTEVNGVIADPTWDIVHTGYDASLEQTIITSADGKIQLTSAVGANNGQIAFASTGSASVAVSNNTVTIGMVWEDF